MVAGFSSGHGPAFRSGRRRYQKGATPIIQTLFEGLDESELTEAQRLTSTAFNLYGSGSIYAVAALLEQAVALDPEVEWAPVKLPYLYEEIQSIKIKRRHLLLTLTEAPEDDQPHHRLAHLHQWLGEMAEARAIWERLTNSADKNAAKYARKMLLRYPLETTP